MKTRALPSAMNNRFGHRFAWAILACLMFALGPACLAANPPTPAGPPPGEAELIRMLGSANPDTVIDALGQLPRRYPASTGAVPAIRGILKNGAVRRQAARALGNYHAELPPEDVRVVLGLLRSPDINDAMDGLKALRDLREPADIRKKIAADIVPLLNDREVHVVRDACRTLAVVGNRDTISALEPLLHHARSDIRQEAQKAIAALSPPP